MLPGRQLDDVDLTTHAVHEEYCDTVVQNQPYTLVKVDRTLTDQEFVALRAALAAARVVTSDGCHNSEATLRQLTVRTNTAQAVTYDSCGGPGPYIDGVDAILAVFPKPE